MVAYQLLFGALGLLCGIGVAAGVFALVASLGMVPRMAGKTSVAAYVPALENALIAGGIFGCVLAVFPELPFPVGTWSLGVYGLASGVFSVCPLHWRKCSTYFRCCFAEWESKPVLRY